MPNPELSQRIRALPEELLGLEREPGKPPNVCGGLTR